MIAKALIALVCMMQLGTATAIELSARFQFLDRGAAVYGTGAQHIMINPGGRILIVPPGGEIRQGIVPQIFPADFPLASLGESVFLVGAGEYEGSVGSVIMRVDGEGVWSTWKGVPQSEEALMHVYPLTDGLAAVTRYLRAPFQRDGTRVVRPPKDAILEIHDRSLALRHTLRLPSSGDIWYHVGGSVERVYGARVGGEGEQARWILFRADEGRIVREATLEPLGVRGIAAAHDGLYTVEVIRGEGVLLARYNDALERQWRVPISPNRGHTLAPLLLFSDQRIVYVGALDNKLFVSVFDREGRKLDELRDDKTGQPFSFSGYAGTLEGQRLRLVGLHIEEAPSPKDEKTRLMFFEAAIP